MAPPPPYKCPCPSPQLQPAKTSLKWKVKSWLSGPYTSVLIFYGLIRYPQPRSAIIGSYGRRVVRTGSRTILKFGSILEVDALLFVSQRTSLPVPKVHGFWPHKQRPSEGWIVMEYIEGDTWGPAWKKMSDEQKNSVISQMKGYMDELRQLKPEKPCPPECVGSISFTPFIDKRISITEHHGPFESIDLFYRHLVWKVELIKGKEKADELFEGLMRLKFGRTSAVVLTHADLAAPNLILRNGKVSGIIDWGQCGWRPYWWEHMKALYSPQLVEKDERREWTQFVESFLEGQGSMCPVQLQGCSKEWLIDFEISGIEGHPA